MEFITIKEVLDVMDSGKLFSIKFITADKGLGSGGEWRHYTNVTKHVQPVYSGSHKTLAVPAAEVAFKAKHPNHFENSTRNIRKANGDIRKVHIRLIRECNGRAVL
jgi:hypothetical protein